MKTYPLWTMATLCWFFALFNIERLVPTINLASFVYVLSTVAGLAMLGSRWVRNQPLGLTAAAFILVWMVGKVLLGYSVHLSSLPLVLTEAFALVVSQYVCLKVAQKTDEFAATSGQLLEVLRACSVPDLREAEGQLLEEIRRARRHGRPLTFVALSPEPRDSSDIKELLRQMERSLSREYAAGCISRILADETKSHDIAVRVDDRFLMLLPETDTEQAAAMSKRLHDKIRAQLGMSVSVESFGFGIDELTLTGVLDRLTAASHDGQPSETPEVFQLQASKPTQPEALELVGSGS